MMVHDNGARTGGEVLVLKTKQQERQVVLRLKQVLAL